MLSKSRFHSRPTASGRSLLRCNSTIQLRCSKTSFQSTLLVNLSIAESCSGIYSIIVFISALISYLIIDYRNLKIHNSFLILMLGIIISYLSNLVRMTIIILSGHYRGMEFLLFVHQYIGWLIFTLWIMIFWFSIGFDWFSSGKSLLFMITVGFLKQHLYFP